MRRKGRYPKKYQYLPYVKHQSQQIAHESAAGCGKIVNKNCHRYNKMSETL